ncbi:hypothetical protein FRB99_000175 [Tulasnella sp. 403]|nr:hypothetical protein FRB99_000175 [Tulasnella sp. 403]
MATPAATDYLSKAISSNKIVTFRLLSRELSIHVNEAKNALAAYHSSVRSSPNPVYATFLVSGYMPEPAAEDPSFSLESSAPKTASAPPVTERRMTLVGEDKLDDTKSQFARIVSIHVYSISPAPVKEIALLATATATVRQIDSQHGVEHARQMGMTIAPDVKWTATSGGSKASTTKQPQPTKSKSTPSESSSKAPTMPTLPAEKKATTLGWSKAKPKSKSDDVPVKKEDKKEIVAAKKTGTLDWSKAKTKGTVVKEEPVEEVDVKPNVSAPSAMKAPEPKTAVKDTKTTTARPASKQTTARPASKQIPSTARKTSVKRASPSTDEEEEEEPPTRNVKPKLTHAPSASTSRTASAISTTVENSRLKKGRVVSDDEEEEEELMRPPVKKRKSAALVEEEETEEEPPVDVKKSRLVKGRNAAEERRQAKAKIDEQLRELAITEEATENPQKDDSMDTDEEESPPEHVPHTKPIKGVPKPKKEKPTGIDVSSKPRKKKTTAPLGRNGKPKRRVEKSRMIKLDNGFMKTEDYSSYESVSESEVEEPAPPPPKKTVAKKTTTQQKSEPKPKTTVKKEPLEGMPRKSATSATLNGWFTKKEK